MEHKEEASQVKAKIAGTDAVAEYFERYERRREGEEEAVEGKMDYWLSEEEQEGGNQLKLRKWKSRSKKEPYVVRHAKAPKLRPAEDVLKRLRWDPSLDIAHFTVGYLERFEGIKEMSMTMWVAESSDEDFIPQHRIKYFKRTSDGEVVWDRGERIDKFFGSGLTGKVADGSGNDDEVLPAVQQQAAISGPTAERTYA